MHDLNAQTPLLRDSDDADSESFDQDNDTRLFEQPVSGAPVELESPLGYEVTLISCVFLNLSQLIGVSLIRL